MAPSENENNDGPKGGCVILGRYPILSVVAFVLSGVSGCVCPRELEALTKHSPKTRI